MSLKVLIVALALTPIGCKEQSKARAGEPISAEARAAGTADQPPPGDAGLDAAPTTT